MDGETAVKDFLPGTGQTSTGESGPSKQTPKTYTEEEVNQRHGKLDKEIASLKKSQETTVKERDELKQMLAEIQKKQEAAELEGIKDKPDEIKIYQKRQDLKKQEEDLMKRISDHEAKEKEFADRLTKADEQELEMKVILAAVENGLSIPDFQITCKEFGAKTDDQIAKLAKLAPKSDGKPTLPKGGSGETLGGINLDNLTPREKIEAGLEKEKKK